MSAFDIDSLTQYQIKQMTRDELVVLVVDWLQRFRDKSALLIKENNLQEDLEKANQQIELLNEKIASLTKELNWSIKQNKYLEGQQIPQLQHELENRGSHRAQLLSEVKQYQTKVKELQSALKNLERDSKQQIDRILLEKRQAMSQITAHKVKIEKQQSEVKKLEFELSRKIDEIGLKNNEIVREKDKSKLLEGTIKALEKQLKEAEKENNILEKKLKKTPKEEAIEKTKIEFKARLNVTSTVLAQEKQRNKTLTECLKKRDIELSNLLKQQPRRRSEPQRQAMVVSKSFEPTASDWRELRKENISLNSQIKALTESRQRDQVLIKDITDQVIKFRTLYISEKIQHENLKEFMNFKPAQVEDNIAVEEPTVKTQTNDKQVQILPPIDKPTLQLPKTKSICNRRILFLSEGKLEPEFKVDFLTTKSDLKQFKPTAPSKRTPERPPFSPTVRKLFPRESERRKKLEGNLGGVPQ
ncbi:rho-associated protein kinase 1-like [Poeciliopsis prolifica]|uniref:rho-associated protein kinase 1-like n=1 Tax=Poeciliopsis prolifica TaxID=188132 RepID=UPI0024136E80|nr:rho-associated protein kinase 1-like [Poeciliopsis prolifica]